MTTKDHRGQGQRAAEEVFVLVHGAWHSSFHWHRLIASLERLGRRAVAIDLPGHGQNARPAPAVAGADQAAFAQEMSYAAGIGTAHAAQAIIDAVRSLRTQLPPIVVAHSVSGSAMTSAAETAPELFGRLVYLAAFRPAGRKSPAAYAQLPEAVTGYGGDLFIGNAVETGAVRIDPNGDDAYLERLRLAYYGDVPFHEFQSYAHALTPDLPTGFWMDEVESTAARWGQVPRTYIRCTRDRALAPAVQTMMIQEADRLTPGNLTDVADLPASHSPFASDPDGLAELLVSLTGRGGNGEERL